MSEYIFDIEADGLLDTITKIHCIVIIKDGEMFSFGPKEVVNAIKMLMSAGPEDYVIGHNILGYDIPAIKFLYPWFKLKAKARDTLLLSRLIWPDVKNKDYKVQEKYIPTFPKTYIGKYSLAAWGYRLGELKNDQPESWDRWTEEMQVYCEQDCKTTQKLWDTIKNRNPSLESIVLEHRFYMIVQKQIEHGFHFDTDYAKNLYADLFRRRARAEKKLESVFHPKIRFLTEYTPKRRGSYRVYADDEKDYFWYKRYAPDAPFSKIKVEEFNPRSTRVVAQRLVEDYNWKYDEDEVTKEKTDFFPKGVPKMNETVIKNLDYDFIPWLQGALVLNKRIGQLAEGRAGWLKLVTDDNRIHGQLVTNGANTGRCTHMKPNTSQATAVDKPFGYSLRSCWIPKKGWVQLGIDLSGIEGRLIAHFLEPYDGGEFREKLLAGDIHTDNLIELQKEFPNLQRYQAKNLFYAMLYGAKNKKLGKMIHMGKEAGARVRAAIYRGIKGLEELIESLPDKYIKTFDGRLIPLRASYKKLNTYIQGGAAVIFKMWLVTFFDMCYDEGYKWKDNYTPKFWAMMANIHDEKQLTCKEELVDPLVELSRKALKHVEDLYEITCPLDISYKVGNNWAETH